MRPKVKVWYTVTRPRMFPIKNGSVSHLHFRTKAKALRKFEALIQDGEEWVLMEKEEDRWVTWSYEYTK